MGTKVKILLLVFLQLFAIACFMKGLWPLKKSLPLHYDITEPPKEPTLSEEKQTNEVQQQSTRELYAPRVKRLVLVVLDALRYDFMDDEHVTNNFPFLNELLREDKAIRFKARAQPPTVTMPRIKTLTSGGIAAYTDIIFNFNSTSFSEDNFIHQARLHGKKLVFYGDDTWQKLFPEAFVRSEGTTSFFVKDFTEVDNNVTRHLKKELEDLDWDVLVLHYLGLDHIGHSFGPFSPHVRPKLNEMDNVIRSIHAALVNDSKDNRLPSIVVICGDHGMSDFGSHGGSSDSETLIPLLFASTNKLDVKKGSGFSENVVSQASVAPTLSVLLGLPIPSNNVGPILLSLFSAESLRRQLYLTFVNAHQLVQLMNVSVASFDEGDVYRDYLKAKHRHAALLATDVTVEKYVNEVLDLYMSVVQQMSEMASTSLSNQDVYLMIIAAIGLWQVHLLLLEQTLLVEKTTSTRSLTWQKIVIVVFVGGTVHWNVYNAHSIKSQLFNLDVFILLFWLMLISFCISTVSFDIVKTYHFVSTKKEKAWIIFFWLLHSVSLLSTSFIEEEHQTWYFLSTSMHFVLITNILHQLMPQSQNSTRMPSIANNKTADRDFNEQKSLFSSGTFAADGATDKPSRARKTFVRLTSALACVLLLRILRSWNQTGEKWAHLADTRVWLNSPENKSFLFMSIASGLVTVYFTRRSHHTRVGNFVIAVGLLGAFVYHLSKNAHFHLSASFIAKLAARTVFSSTVLTLLEPLYGRWQEKDYSPSGVMVTAWVLLNSVLVRPHNVFLLSALPLHEVLMLHALGSTGLQEKVAFYFCMAMASFFYQGNSNSLARVDVAAGFVGITEYNPFLNGWLMWCHTYAAFGFWMLCLLGRTTSLGSNAGTFRRSGEVVEHVCALVLLIRSLPVALFVTSVLLQRNHLFVWSVFSPKLLFEGMHSVFVAVVVCTHLITRT